MLDHAARVNELLRQGRLGRVSISAGQPRAIEPTLDLNPYGGFYTPSDLSGDVHKVSHGIAKALEAHGAVLNLETSLSDLRAANCGATLAWKRTAAASITEQANFNAVVICGELASASLGAMVGDHIQFIRSRVTQLQLDLRMRQRHA